MFPTPIDKTSRAWQLTYQGLLPLALIFWLLPLIAVAVFSVRPEADFANGSYWGVPTSYELLANYGKVCVSDRVLHAVHAQLHSRLAVSID